MYDFLSSWRAVSCSPMESNYSAGDMYNFLSSCRAVSCSPVESNILNIVAVSSVPRLAPNWHICLPFKYPWDTTISFKNKRGTSDVVLCTSFGPQRVNIAHAALRCSMHNTRQPWLGLVLCDLMFSTCWPCLAGQLWPAKCHGLEDCQCWAEDYTDPAWKDLRLYNECIPCWVYPSHQCGLSSKHRLNSALLALPTGFVFVLCLWCVCSFKIVTCFWPHFSYFFLSKFLIIFFFS